MPAFDRIFIMMFENEPQSAVLKNAYMKELAGRGAFLSNYWGISHPSQTNYIAAIAGSTFGVNTDNPVNLAQNNLVDLLEAKGISWKAYIQDLPVTNKTVTSKGLYFRKHNPFVSFTDIQTPPPGQPSRMDLVVEAGQLFTDVVTNKVPQYSWYTPNIQNDGHTPPSDYQPSNPERGVNYLARFLQAFLDPLLKTPEFATGTLVVVTFDEALPPAPNQIYTVLLGDMVTPGTVITSGPYNHYSLLRTVEENFDLGTLGRGDATAEPFYFLLGGDPAPQDLASHYQAAEQP